MGPLATRQKETHINSHTQIVREKYNANFPSRTYYGAGYEVKFQRKINVTGCEFGWI